MADTLNKLASDLKPIVIEWVQSWQAGGGGGVPSPHDMSGPHHSGSLDPAQAPWALTSDGQRMLVGNLQVAPGVLIDGVDISEILSSLNPVDDEFFRHINDPHAHHLAITGVVTDTIPIPPHPTTFQVDFRGGDFSWTGIQRFNQTTYTQHMLPLLPDTYDLGSATVLWRKIWASEIDTLVFAINTIQVVGGMLMVAKDQGALHSGDLPPNYFNYIFEQPMTTGDFLLLRQVGASGPMMEYMRVGDRITDSEYPYEYWIDRDLDGSGANFWPAGSAFVVLGQNGQGRIELQSHGDGPPRISLVQQGAAYNLQTEMARLGSLDGAWGYTGNVWGLAVGIFTPGQPNIVVDSNGALRIRNYTQDVIRLDAAGSRIESLLTLGVGGEIRQGTGTWGSNFTGLRIYRSGSVGVWATYGNQALQTYIDPADLSLAAGAARLRSDGLSFIQSRGVGMLAWKYDATTPNATAVLYAQYQVPGYFSTFVIQSGNQADAPDNYAGDINIQAISRIASSRAIDPYVVMTHHDRGATTDQSGTSILYRAGRQFLNFIGPKDPINTANWGVQNAFVGINFDSSQPHYAEHRLVVNGGVRIGNGSIGSNGYNLVNSQLELVAPTTDDGNGNTIVFHHAGSNAQAMRAYMQTGNKYLDLSPQIGWGHQILRHPFHKQAYSNTQPGWLFAGWYVPLPFYYAIWQGVTVSSTGNGNYLVYLENVNVPAHASGITVRVAAQWAATGGSYGFFSPDSTIQYCIIRGMVVSQFIDGNFIVPISGNVGYFRMGFSGPAPAGGSVYCYITGYFG